MGVSLGAQPSTGETQESMNNVSCRRDMTEILLKGALNAIQSINLISGTYSKNNLRLHSLLREHTKNFFFVISWFLIIDDLYCFFL